MEDYIVSARKYRPTTFDSVVGQKNLTDTFRNAIRLNHLAHAYLFCGPRGVGKTTCARIFAKTINCLNPTPENDACNECESCRAFNEQRSFNIHELDAASNNSVEDIRTLIQEVRIPPQIGKYSVYIIDEVHMLSQGAFNALLKTLEEPPSYAVFILATTEKHKVLPTILSRCQVYDFQRITVRDTISHLQHVANQEGVETDEQALNVVAQKADGGMRDALSIFDQLVSFCGNRITYAQAIEVLNVLDTDYYFKLVDAALRQDVSSAFLLFDEVLRKGFDAGPFISGLAQHLRDVLVSKDVQTVKLLETSEAIQKQYADQASICTAPWLFKALDVVNTCDINYRTARNKRLTVELCLVKLCQLMTQDAVPAAAPLRPLTTQASQTTKQTEQKIVSASAPASTASKPAAYQPVTPATPKGIKTLNGLPSIKLGANTASAAKKEEQPDNQTHRNNPFTIDQLVGAWVGLTKQFQGEERLQNMMNLHRPALNGEYEAVVTLSNTWQKEEMMRFRPAILELLHDRLLNDNISLRIEVGEFVPEQKAYTSEDKFKLLVAKNQELAVLKKSLNLLLD